MCFISPALSHDNNAQFQPNARSSPRCSSQPVLIVGGADLDLDAVGDATTLLAAGAAVGQNAGAILALVNVVATADGGA